MLNKFFKSRRSKVVTVLIIATLLCLFLIIPSTVWAGESPQNNGDIEGEDWEGYPTEDEITGLDTLMATGQDLDIGLHNHCYSYTGHARGYYFTAPTDFTITALRVPTNCSSDVQSVTVLKINSTLPIWPSTTNDFSILGLWQGIAGSEWIECNIPVAKGQLIGITGARGTSTMYNSYTSNYIYNTTLGGYPITLRRLATNDNMYSANPQNIYTSNTYYGRIEMEYLVDPLIPMVEELHAKVDALHVKVDEIQTTVNETNQIVETLDTKVDAIDAKIDALSAAIAQTSVDLQVVEIKEKEQYLLGTTVLGIPVDAELLGVQASAMKINQPVIFTSVPATASLAKTGVLEVTIELPKGLEDAQVFEFSVRYGSNYGSILFYK